MNERFMIEAPDETVVTSALTNIERLMLYPAFNNPRCEALWSSTLLALRFICFPNGQYQKSSASRIRKVEDQLLKHAPGTLFVGDNSQPAGLDRLAWTVSLLIMEGVPKLTSSSALS
jgi:hypothetical protein